MIVTVALIRVWIAGQWSVTVLLFPDVEQTVKWPDTKYSKHQKEGNETVGDIFFVKQQPLNKKSVTIKNDHKSKSEQPVVSVTQKDHDIASPFAAMQKDQRDGHERYPAGKMQNDGDRFKS